MRPRVRAAVVLWLVLGVVVWNVIFDYHVQGAAGRYVWEAMRAFRYHAPPVTMDGVMRPAIARGIRSASAWGGLITGAGLAAVAFGARRTGRRRGADPKPGADRPGENRA